MKFRLWASSSCRSGCSSFRPCLRGITRGMIRHVQSHHGEGYRDAFELGQTRTCDQLGDAYGVEWAAESEMATGWDKIAQGETRLPPSAIGLVTARIFETRESCEIKDGAS